MADNGSKTPNPFDVRTIKDLVGLMSRHGLTEIDLREGDLRIRLRRGPSEVAITTSPGIGLPSSIPVAPSAANSAPPPAKTNEEPKATKNVVPIKSPTPGTFYSSSSPDAEPFVRVGSKVTPSTVVCLIEAMKIFNEITADCTGTITEVSLENQQPVEYGQVLFKVDPTT